MPRPRCPAPVGRSIRSLLVLNTSLTKIGSLITTAWPKSGKLTVNALPYRRPRAANIPCVAAKNAMPCTVFGIRGPGGSRTASVVSRCHVFPAFLSLVVPVLKSIGCRRVGRTFGTQQRAPQRLPPSGHAAFHSRAAPRRRGVADRANRSSHIPGSRWRWILVNPEFSVRAGCELGVTDGIWSAGGRGWPAPRVTTAFGRRTDADDWFDEQRAQGSPARPYVYPTDQ